MFEYYEGWHTDRHRKIKEDMAADKKFTNEIADIIEKMLNASCAACPLNAIALEVHKEGLN